MGWEDARTSRDGQWQDTRTWGDVAAERNGQPTDGDAPNPWWATPNGNNNPWQAPGNSDMFRDPKAQMDDPTHRAFTSRKKHWWWGKDEFYDEHDRKIG